MTASLSLKPNADDFAAVVEHVRSHLAPILVGAGRLEKLSEPPIPSLLVATTVKQSGITPSETDLAEPRRLDSEWSGYVSSLNEYGRDKVKSAHAAHQRSVAEGTLAGRPPVDAFNRADFETDFEARRAAIKAAALQKSTEASRLLLRFSDKVVTALRERAEEIAVEEFRRFAAYGVDFTPSLLVRTLLAAAANVDRQVSRLMERQGGLGTSPRSQFAIIGIAL